MVAAAAGKGGASVQRLVRDGVDTTLANLFACVARTVTPDAEGVSRARGSTEAFLYRRLETLPETAGRFRVNAELPIPFDSRGRMEVDLLCANARVTTAQRLAHSVTRFRKPHGSVE